jgi:hypothetical protein
VGFVHTKVETFNKALDEFAKEAGWTMEYTILREGALMCRDAIIFTPPFIGGGGGGETKQAEIVGKNAVKRDINSLFVAVNDKAKISGAMMLNQLASAAKMRDFASFENARAQISNRTISFDSHLANKFAADGDPQRAYLKAQNFFNKYKVRPANLPVDDLRSVHDQYKHLTRQGKTRITRGQGDYLGKFLVKSKGELNAYIKTRQEEVGKLKSGWWNVIEALPKPKKKGVEQNFGRKGVAAYVKKFPGNNMQAFISTPDRVSLLIGNQIGNNDDVASRNNVMNLIYANAVARIEKDLEQMIKRDVQKFNNGEIR